MNLPKTIEQCAEIRGCDVDQLAEQLAESRAKLLAARARRVAPGRDDKVLVGWNALMINALARAGAALAEPRYVDAATQAAGFVRSEMRREDGRLLHTWRAGAAKLDAYLDDYTCLVNALVSLYEATFDEQWVTEAMRLADIVLARFADPEGGGFFYTADDHEALITRQKDWHESSTPSGNSMAAFALARLGRLTGRKPLVEAALATMRAAAPLMRQQPMAAGQMLLAVDNYVYPQPEIVLLGSGEDFDQVVAELRRRYLPGLVLAARRDADQATNKSAALSAIFAGKTLGDRGPAAYVCQEFACRAPVQGKAAILAAWAEA